MAVEDWMGDGGQGWAADVFVKCSFCQYVAGYVLWVAGRTIHIPLESISSLCVCEPFTVKVVSCVCTTAKAEINLALCYSWVRAVGERVKWPQLLSILLPKPLWLAVLLAIFLSPSSPSVHSRWVLLQVPHNVLELWGNSERNCSVNWQQSVKGWKHSQFMKDLCVCLFVCISPDWLVFFFNSIWMMSTEHLLFLLLQRHIYCWNFYGDSPSVIHVSEYCFAVDYNLSSLCCNNHSNNIFPFCTWVHCAWGQLQPCQQVRNSVP